MPFQFRQPSHDCCVWIRLELRVLSTTGIAGEYDITFAGQLAQHDDPRIGLIAIDGGKRDNLRPGIELFAKIGFELFDPPAQWAAVARPGFLPFPKWQE